MLYRILLFSVKYQHESAIGHTHIFLRKKKVRLSVFVKLINNEIFTFKHLKHKLTAKEDNRSIIKIITNIYLALYARHSSMSFYTY